MTGVIIDVYQPPHAAEENISKILHRSNLPLDQSLLTGSILMVSREHPLRQKEKENRSREKTKRYGGIHIRRLFLH